jgi:hypothetical protein
MTPPAVFRSGAERQPQHAGRLGHLSRDGIGSRREDDMQVTDRRQVLQRALALVLGGAGAAALGARAAVAETWREEEQRHADERREVERNRYEERRRLEAERREQERRDDARRAETRHEDRPVR